jgi:hypothetical protein
MEKVVQRAFTLASRNNNNNNNNSNNNSNTDGDQEYELVNHANNNQLSWTNTDHESVTHRDALSSAETDTASASDTRAYNDNIDNDFDSDEEPSLATVAAVVKSSSSSRFYVSLFLTALAVTAYVLTLKLGTGVVRLEGIFDKNEYDQNANETASRDKNHSVVLLGLTGFVRDQTVNDDYDSSDTHSYANNTAAATAAKPWKGVCGYAVAQQVAFVWTNGHVGGHVVGHVVGHVGGGGGGMTEDMTSDSVGHETTNTFLNRGRTVWFLWLVWGVGLPWLVSLAASWQDKTDTDETDSSTDPSTRRRFQLVTCGLCWMAAVIPLFAVHSILQSRLCQGTFIELHTSSSVSSSLSHYYYPTDATVHEQAQASCSITTNSDSDTNSYTNNYSLVLAASGLWAFVAVAMFVLAVRPTGRQAQTTVSATTSVSTVSSATATRMTSNDKIKISQGERATLAALLLTLAILALYVALIPFWVGGSGLLQILVHVKATTTTTTTTATTTTPVTHTKVVLGATSWNPPQDIRYTEQQQDMVDANFAVANWISCTCFPLLAVLVVYILVSMNMMLFHFMEDDDTGTGTDDTGGTDNDNDDDNEQETAQQQQQKVHMQQIQIQKRIRILAVAALVAAGSAVTSYIIPASVLRSKDFCTVDVYYEFGFQEQPQRLA